MNNKILISSIIAVAILILVSFTGVVGYQITKSSTIDKVSPLFFVRSSRAIDEENNNIVCNYVGKENSINIYIPDKTDDLEYIDASINFIQRMNDINLKYLAIKLTYYLHQFDESQQYTNEYIFQSLKQLRDNPDSVYSIIEKEKEPTFYFSCVCPDTSKLTQCWGLYLAILFLASYILTFAIAVYGYAFFTSLFNCDPNLP